MKMRLLAATLNAALMACAFASPVVSFDGDSLTEGVGSTGGTNGTPEQVTPGEATIVNNGDAGERASQNTAALRTIATFDAAAGGAKLTAVYREGINDVAINDSVANITGYIDDWIAAVRAAHPDAFLIGCTLTDYVGMGATFEGRVDAINTHILTVADFDATVDLAADSRLDDPSDATYYSDSTHHTDAGYAVCAELVDAVLAANNRIVAGGTTILSVSGTATINLP